MYIALIEYHSPVHFWMQVAYVISALLVLVTIYLIAPLFDALPMCVLASVVAVSTLPLFVHYTMWLKYWRTCRYDFAIWLVSFCGTFLAGVDYGILVGVAFSVFVVHYRMQVYIRFGSFTSHITVSHLLMIYAHILKHKFILQVRYAKTD